MVPFSASSVVFALLMDSKNTDMVKGIKRKRLAEKDKAKPESIIARTNSFLPIWAGTYNTNTTIKVHTLILGTHPSITSLGKCQYYGHPMNAFWWIAGDCLGFRRDSAISPSTGKPYTFESKLRYGMGQIISYEEQVTILVNQGFALWDVIASCERPSSLDIDIFNDVPNDIRSFCEVQHPTIRRIVLANGMKQSELFAKHFASWWESGTLRPFHEVESTAHSGGVKAFQKFAKKTDHFRKATIVCVVGPGVSPAAASISYEKKRQFYEMNCYLPGLTDHKRLNNNAN